MLGASSDHIYDANYKVDQNQHSEKKNKKRKIVVKNFLVSNNNNHNNKPWNNLSPDSPFFQYKCHFIWNWID